MVRAEKIKFIGEEPGAFTAEFGIWPCEGLARAPTALEMKSLQGLKSPRRMCMLVKRVVCPGLLLRRRARRRVTRTRVHETNGWKATRMPFRVVGPRTEGPWKSFFLALSHKDGFTKRTLSYLGIGPTRRARTSSVRHRASRAHCTSAEFCILHYCAVALLRSFCPFHLHKTDSSKPCSELDAKLYYWPG